MEAMLIDIVKDPIIGLDLVAMLFTVFYLGKLAFADFVSLDEETAPRSRNRAGNRIEAAEQFGVGSFVSLPKFALEKRRMLVELRA